jgi:hypothetical protein
MAGLWGQAIIGAMATRRRGRSRTHATISRGHDLLTVALARTFRRSPSLTGGSVSYYCCLMLLVYWPSFTTALLPTLIPHAGGTTMTF